MAFVDDLNDAFPPGTEAARDVLRVAHEVEIANAEAAAGAAAEQARLAAETALEQAKADAKRREEALQAANLSLALKVGVAPGVATPAEQIAEPAITTIEQMKAEYLSKPK